jgi:predicted nucleic-acid-binding protein
MVGIDTNVLVRFLTADKLVTKFRGCKRTPKLGNGVFGGEDALFEEIF